MIDAPRRIMADRQLVDRCLTGDALGWEELYSRCHGRMVAAIRSLFASTSGSCVAGSAANWAFSRLPSSTNRDFGTFGISYFEFVSDLRFRI